MTIRIVRLGSERHPNEGPRIGTVRRPPRGVPKVALASRNFYDVWLPNLAPSDALLKSARADPAAGDERSWKNFVRKYRGEMNTPDNRALLATLAVLSRRTDFSLGCYCVDAERCHRSLLRGLLIENGATIE